LAVYDDPKNGGNGDGVIDARDAVFASLRLWIDANHDGISQPEELHTLPSLGVNSISLTYKEDRRTDQFGNVFRYRVQVNPGDATNTAGWRTTFSLLPQRQRPRTDSIQKGVDARFRLSRLDCWQPLEGVGRAQGIE